MYNKDFYHKYYKKYYLNNKDVISKKQLERYHNIYKKDPKHRERNKINHNKWYLKQRLKRKLCWICNIELCERTFYKYHIYNKTHHKNSQKLKFVIHHKDYTKKTWYVVKKKNFYIKKESSLILVKDPIILEFAL